MPVVVVSRDGKVREVPFSEFMNMALPEDQYRARTVSSSRVKRPIPKVSKREKVYRRHQGRCHYCNVKLTRSQATLDHKVPRAIGGSNNIENLALACGRCNNEKADTPYDEFRERKRKMMT